MNRVEELCLKISDFHLLTLSETWLHKEILDSKLEIPGYRLFRRDRGDKGGGLAVYARNDVDVLRRSDLESSTIEGLWVKVCSRKSRSFLVGTFYRPPSTSKHVVGNFVPLFENNIQSATVREKELIILGDFNCDMLAKQAVSVECKRLKGVLRSENLTQLIDQPTRVNTTGYHRYECFS